MARHDIPQMTPPADLTIVGSVMGPQQLPDQILTVTPDMLGYQDLFAFIAPDGSPARGMYRGTFAPTVGAMPRGA